MQNQSNSKLSDFEKYFDEKCSSIFDDEDDDPFGGIDTENPLNTSFKKERPSLLPAAVRNDFATLDDPFLSDDSKGIFLCEKHLLYLQQK